MTTQSLLCFGTHIVREAMLLIHSEHLRGTVRNALRKTLSA
jgi:hypothetical protein